MAERAFPRHEGEWITCSEPGCEVKIKNHYWGRVKSNGWFHQKSGESWCPAHVPDWVEAWRAKSARPSSAVVSLAEADP